MDDSTPVAAAAPAPDEDSRYLVDQLMQRVAELERRGAEADRRAGELETLARQLDADLSAETHPLKRIFLAKLTGSAAWNEQCLESGAAIDYGDGRTGTAAPLQLAATAGSVTLPMLEDRDSTSHSYIPLIFLGTAVFVTLTSTSGSGGDQGTAPSFVYTAVTVRGDTVGTGLSPTKGRRNGKFTAADFGLGYFDASGTFVLVLALETPGTGGCSGGA